MTPMPPAPQPVGPRTPWGDRPSASRGRVARGAGTAVLALSVLAPSASASPESERLRLRALDEIYNLDRDRALDSFRQAVAADADDPAAHRGMATAYWLSITFRRGNMTVDDYLGKVSRPSTRFPPPAADVVDAFNGSLDRSIALSRQRIKLNPRDAEAHYQLGAAIGVRASYYATVDGSTLGAFRSAREAYEEHETVLELDSRRGDAALIVGTYRYIVAALALPLRWFAYMAGFGGGRQAGIQLVERAAAYDGDNQVDAQLALVLLYNRERRYDDALRVLEPMRQRYPRNRLLWLESTSTALRGGRGTEAERLVTDGLARAAADTRPRMFGEEALWHYKHGAALAATGRDTDARAALGRALATEGRKWVHGRAHFELGRLALKVHNEAQAQAELREAAALCQADNDLSTAEEAKRLLR
jgi:tetratricopeptide (TPR) repeat protein